MRYMLLIYENEAEKDRPHAEPVPAHVQTCGCCRNSTIDEKMVEA